MGGPEHKQVKSWKILRFQFEIHRYNYFEGQYMIVLFVPFNGLLLLSPMSFTLFRVLASYFVLMS